MKWFILAFLFSIQSQSSSELLDVRIYEDADWDSLKAAALARHQSVSSLNQQLADLQKLKSLRLLCETQLRSSRIPVSCLELLDLEKKLKLLSVQKWSINQERLDSLCLRNLRLIDDVANDQFRLRLPKSRCQSEMRVQLEKLRYGSSFSDPLSVFSSRHRF
jgi:hypothetical protein